MCMQLSIVMTQFSTVTKDREKTSLFPLTLTSRTLRDAFPLHSASPRAPLKFSLGYWRLHLYPLRESHLFVFSPSPGPGSSCRPMKSQFRKLISPKYLWEVLFWDSGQLGYLCSWKWYLLVALDTYFSGSHLPDSLLFSYRTVYFGLQQEGPSLLQVCFPILCLHSFIVLKTESKYALLAARTVLGPSPSTSS